MALPGETEAGSAGTQPCRGIAWRAHRDEAGERGSRLSRSSQNHIGSKDPHALKIPARRAECSLTGNARFPFQAEPEQILKRSLLFAAGAALLLGTLSTPVMSSSAHGAKYVQEGGTWTVCLCQVNNTNCQPCQ
jgi:hypothetical protein